MHNYVDDLLHKEEHRYLSDGIYEVHKLGEDDE